jgi:uncharacterized membrane protein YGL010W
MEPARIAIRSIVLWAIALPVSIITAITLSDSPGFGGFPLALPFMGIVLLGIAAAIHWLLRDWRDGWAISVLLAVVTTMAVLSVVALLTAKS